MVRNANLAVVDYPLTLDYSYWPADHILKVWTDRDDGSSTVLAGCRFRSSCHLRIC